MTTSTVNNTAYATGADTTDRSAAVAKSTLGQNDFLKLLSVQLANQDPLSPVDNADFMAQMAQFSSLEQATQLTTQMTAMRNDTQFQAANSLLGREVAYENLDGETVTGVVNGVEPYATGVLLDVEGTFISFDSVLRVTPAPTTPTPTTTTSPEV